MRIITSVLVFLCTSFPLFAQISVQTFSTGYTSPVDIKNCGDDRLFIVEQGGIIRIVDTTGVKMPGYFLDINDSVISGSERGLLGLAFPEDFLVSRYFYVNYTAEPDGRTRISRFRVDSLNPDSAIRTSEEVLLEIYQPYGNHNGGHLAFGPDGYLYIGTGDGGSGGDPGDRAQNADSLLGKMLRIEVSPSIPTYSIPPTNPFAVDTTLGRPEIWGTGLRNPWRYSFDRWTGDLWIGDVGQSQREEVDFVANGTPGGMNFGWNCWEGTRPYDTTAVFCPPYAELVAPVFEYTHSSGCSITGGYIYRGTRYQELYGKYFFIDYCTPEMRYVQAADTGGFVNTNLGNIGGSSITSFGEDAAGEIYLSGSGNIYKLMSANCNPVATINEGRDTVKDCGTGLVNLSLPYNPGYSYLWTYNGDTVSTTGFCLATQPGMYMLEVTNGLCSNSDSVYVDFTSLPVSFSGLDTLYCVYHNPVFLFPNPLGGEFSGPGMNGISFDPAAAGVGLHSIQYAYTDLYGCTYTTSQQVRVDACLNVPDEEFLSSTTVYPNPSAHSFSVRTYSPNPVTSEITISDIAGRIVFHKDIALQAGADVISFSHELANGSYLMRLANGNSSVVRPVIINR